MDLSPLDHLFSSPHQVPLSQLEQTLQKLLEAQGFSKDDARRETGYLLDAVLSFSPLERLQNKQAALSTLPLSLQQKLQESCRRRLQKEPLSKILGKRAFWKDTFLINTHVLDPRPETEGLIDHALQYFLKKPAPRHILDLGTGSGCLLLSLLREFPQAQGIGVDFSSKALAIAQENSRILGLSHRTHFRESDWFSSLPSDANFDLIVSNPPYIDHEHLKVLPTEVQQFDPLLALDGGQDGLDAYRSISKAVPAYLKPNGLLALEIGFDQGDRVPPLFANSFSKVTVHQDLSGHPRYVLAHGR